MISYQAVEVLPGTDVLAVGGMRRFGKAGSGQVGSRALGAAIGFTRFRHLTVLILNQRRPVRTDYGAHQLGKILTEHACGSRRLEQAFLLFRPIGRRQVEKRM